MITDKDEAARYAQAELVNTQQVKDLFTARQNCKGCGECCSRFLPMSIFDIERVKSYLRKHEVKAVNRKATIDLLCPYLNDSHECSIYPARPEICRIYRCDKHLKRTLKPPQFVDSMTLVDMRTLEPFD